MFSVIVPFEQVQTMYILTYFLSLFITLTVHTLFYDFTETDATSKALAGAMSGNSKSSDGRKGPASRGKYNIQQIDIQNSNKKRKRERVDNMI